MKRAITASGAMPRQYTQVVASSGEHEAVLRLTRGAARLRLGTTSDLSVLAASSGDPHVRIAGDRHGLTVRYPRTIRPWRSHVGIDISDAVRWTIEFDKGAADIDADLSGAQIAAIRFRSSASRVLLRLPQTPRPCTIRFDRPVERVTFLRPAGIGVLVHLVQAATDIDLDGTLYDIARNTNLTSGQSSPTYEIDFRRAATRVVSAVDTTRPKPAGPAPSYDQVGPMTDCAGGPLLHAHRSTTTEETS